MSDPVSPNDGSAESPSVQPGKRIRGRISIDLQGSYDSWISWCRSMGLPPSDALRGLVARLRPGEWPNEPAVPSVGTREPDGTRALIVERPKVPLNDQEARAVAELADLEGMTVPRWIVGIIRAHLYDRPLLGAPALDALRRSNLEVQAAGRSLNQVARALNDIVEHLDQHRLGEAAAALQAQRGDEVRRVIHEIRDRINGHLPLVSAVLSENAQRWRVRVRRIRG